MYLGYPDSPNYRIKCMITEEQLRLIEKDFSTPLDCAKELFKTLFKEDLFTPDKICCTKTTDCKVRLVDQKLLHGIRCEFTS